VLRCVAVCCSVLQCVAVFETDNIVVPPDYNAIPQLESTFSTAADPAEIPPVRVCG